MAQTFNTLLPAVAVRYARLLGIKITEMTLRRDLEENSYYPSLLSLSDTFDRYGIPNAAYELEGENFDQAEAPFIAYVRTRDGLRDFTLVTHNTGDSVTFVYDRPITLSKADFLQKYQKIVWMAEPGEYAGEKGFEEKMAQEKAARAKMRIGMAVGVLCFAALVCVNLGYWGDGVAELGGGAMAAFGVLLVTKVLGLTVAVLLLMYESGSGGDFVKHLCQANAQTDCGAVLGSKAATVAGITWSEAGFFYFAATLSGLLFPGISLADKAWWLCWGGFLTIWYIPFSLYYQWRVVKQWCPLCLGVQTVLLLEGVWSFVVYGRLASAPSMSILPALLFCAVWPVVAWFFLKPLIGKARDSEQYRGAYRRLRSNPELFQGLLQQQAQAPDGWQELGIMLGNPEGPIRITKVCNPYCQPCADAHPLLEELLERNKNIQLRILFNVRNVEGDRKTPVVKHFLALAGRRDPVLMQQALDDWYGAPRKDFEAFAGKYPLSEGEGDNGAAIDAMGEWCTEAEIAYTPTIFVNGYRLPEDYSAKELREIF